MPYFERIFTNTTKQFDILKITAGICNMVTSKKFLISSLPWVVLIFFCFIVSNKINELTSKKDSQEIIGNQKGSSIVKVEASKTLGRRKS